MIEGCPRFMGASFLPTLPVQAPARDWRGQEIPPLRKNERWGEQGRRHDSVVNVLGQDGHLFFNFAFSWAERTDPGQQPMLAPTAAAGDRVPKTWPRMLDGLQTM